MSKSIDRQYFSRAGTWHVLGERVVVNDRFSPRAPRVITMEPWHEVAFMAADGVHTVGEFIESMAKEYPSGSPDGLAEQIREIVSILVDEGIVRLHEHSKPLPSYFAENYFDQPPEIRASQMRADGLLK